MNITTKRIGITGGRDYTDRLRVYHVLDKCYTVLKERMFLVVGCANGVDKFARQWADQTLASDKYHVYRADWAAFGASAGHKRNREMLHSGLDLLIVFPGGRGTANMKKQTEDLNKESGMCLIKILEIDRE